MINFGKIAWYPALLMCVACTAPIEVKREPVDVTFSSKAASDGVKGFDPIHVRSYQVVDKKRSETTGASCSFSGSGFSGSVVTPAIVNLPDYGGKSRAIIFRCSDGVSTETVQLLPYNVTSRNNLNAAQSGAGLLGLFVVAGYNAARDKAEDDWSYPPVSVAFDVSTTTVEN